MKKVLAIAVLGGLFSLTSCKKDRSCECCYDFLGSKSCTTYTAKLKKKDAQAWCEGSGSSSLYSCELK
jgi:hypothetical protein